MKDYSHYTVMEVVNTQIVDEFITVIKQMDDKIIKARLTALLNGNKTDVSFLNLAGQLISLNNTKTCVDNE